MKQKMYLLTESIVFNCIKQRTGDVDSLIVSAFTSERHCSCVSVSAANAVMSIVGADYQASFYVVHSSATARDRRFPDDKRLSPPLRLFCFIVHRQSEWVVSYRHIHT